MTMDPIAAPLTDRPVESPASRSPRQRPYLMRVMGFGFRRPKNRVPGLDVAATVVAVGS